MPDEIQEAVRDCLDCYRTCTATFGYCLQKGGEHAKTEHLKLLWDCAELCRVTATFLIRESDFGKKVAEECADVCNRCTEECSEFRGDETMQQCADICRKCALSCRQVARG